MTSDVEQLEFQAETRQLLELMIHSVYSEKDIFLRELISNASDALDKLRLAAFRDKDLDADTSDLHIEIDPDADARTLTVRDNGIGMSRDEVVELIGTLAKSGTADLRRKLAEVKDSAAPEELIGQFGIGFYSTFMVADKVTLLTRRAGETHGTRWESTGEATYTIEAVDEAPQGTSITLHLKPADTDDALYDYTQPWKIKQIVKRYSDFISFPIRMEVPPPPPAEGDAEASEATGDVAAPITRQVEFETINSMKALWTRKPSDVTPDEYKEFYRHVSHAWDDPLEIITLKAEGSFEYQALLFIPSTAPFDTFMREHKRGVQLYVKRVFIMDNCEELMPEYLRFVKGVVDAQDLSLNVSREILQQDRHLKLIQKRLVKKVLSTIKSMQSGDAEKYATFWTEFGRVLKEGLLGDTENRETILEVSSFASTASDEGLTTLADYVERMKDGQEQIYYMTGESRQQIEASPHMEAFKAKGREVLLLTDPVDEMWAGSPGFEFAGKKFQSIAKGEVDLESDEEKEATESLRSEQEKEFGDLLTWLGTTLEDQVKQVRLSTRLTTSPACIVGDAFDFSPGLERMYRASGQELPTMKRILELNPSHPLVTGLRTAHAERPDDAGLVETAELLYGTAVLAEGGELSDPAKFARLLADRLVASL